jgi:hypothetical protein
VRCPSPLPRDPPAVPSSSLASPAAGGTILVSGDDTLRGSCGVHVDKGRSTGVARTAWLPPMGARGRRHKPLYAGPRTTPRQGCSLYGRAASGDVGTTLVAKLQWSVSMATTGQEYLSSYCLIDFPDRYHYFMICWCPVHACSF